MKLLVKTNGSFQLLDAIAGNLIRHEGLSVVQPSHFLTSRTAVGQVSVIAELNDDATDEEWLAYAAESDGDLDLAVESFKSAYPPAGNPSAEKSGSKPTAQSSKAAKAEAAKAAKAEADAAAKAAAEQAAE